MKSKLLLTLMAVTLIMIGCGSDDKPADESVAQPGPEPAAQPVDKPVAPPPDQPGVKPAETKAAFSQDTPQDTLKAFFSCLEDGDKEKLRAVTIGDAQAVDAWSGILDFTVAYMEFERAAVAEYGLEAWQKASQKTGSMGPSSEYQEMMKKMDSMEVEIEGDRAACTLPDEQDTFHLTRQEDKWYLDISELTGGDPQGAAQMKELMPKMVEAVRQVQKTIGQPGVTCESLVEELNQKIIDTMFGEMNKPLIDVDKLKKKVIK